MPELPEVEVTRRGIAEPLCGARVVSVRTGKPLRWPFDAAPGRLIGATLGLVERRGKYLWLPLTDDPIDAGPSDALPAASRGGLLLHLGMSGSLGWLPGTVPVPGAHDHFDLVTDRGTLRLRDPRRFGAVVYSPALALPPASTLLARLGAEPFDAAFTPAALHAALQKKRRAPIKPVLLGGDVVVGAGNIYACEALHEAGIHPAMPAHRLSRPRAGRLLAALRSTMGRALDAGGSSLRDYSGAGGESGRFQTQAAVYGRAGQPCRRCTGTVRRTVQGQRATFFCPGCQKR